MNNVLWIVMVHLLLLAIPVYDGVAVEGDGSAPITNRYVQDDNGEEDPTPSPDLDPPP